MNKDKLQKDIEATEPTKAQLIGEIMEVTVNKRVSAVKDHHDYFRVVIIDIDLQTQFNARKVKELISGDIDNITTEQLQQCLNKLKEL